MTCRVLYVTWDGPGPNYLESLFLPIFGRIREQAGNEFCVLQYSWNADDRSASVAAAAVRHDIDYVSRQVPARPTVLRVVAGIVQGAVGTARLARRRGVHVLAPRSIVPAAMCLLALPLLPRGVKLLYDADGLMADERADFGGWSRAGLAYRLLRRIEAAALRRASVVVTRTERSIDVLDDRAPGAGIPDKTFVTPNGKDETEYRPGSPDDRAAVRQSLGIEREAPVVAYAGSLGPQYLPTAMVTFFGAVHALDDRARFLLMTSQLDTARDLLRRIAIPDHAVRLTHVAPATVPGYLAAADLGVALRRPSLSQTAVAPLKVAEYLLCGLPIVATIGIGDLDEQLCEGVGHLVDPSDPGRLETAAGWFVEDVLPQRDAYRQACRRLALEEFSLDWSVGQYQRALMATCSSQDPQAQRRRA